MPSIPPRLRAAPPSLRRAVLRRRRPLAVLCAAAAVAVAVHSVAAPPPATTTVLTAAHDLPGGAALAADDLTAVEFTPESVPEGAVTDPAGRILAAPVRAGEAVTDVRLVGEDLADAHPELATLPVRFPDAGQAALLEVGDRIDLVATDPQAGGTREVADDVLVLATPRADPGTAGAVPGVVVVLGVPPESVADVTEAGVRWFLGYSWSR
ncbi:MAG TPA: SAF domain-containing protein [Nocardioides sp.]|nr:SAF domain-containing protein [Nocardioides sp.]